MEREKKNEKVTVRVHAEYCAANPEAALDAAGRVIQRAYRRKAYAKDNVNNGT